MANKLYEIFNISFVHSWFERINQSIDELLIDIENCKKNQQKTYLSYFF